MIGKYTEYTNVKLGIVNTCLHVTLQQPIPSLFIFSFHLFQSLPWICQPAFLHPFTSVGFSSLYYILHLLKEPSNPLAHPHTTPPLSSLYYILHPLKEKFTPTPHPSPYPRRCCSEMVYCASSYTLQEGKCLCNMPSQDAGLAFFR